MIPEEVDRAEVTERELARPFLLPFWFSCVDVIRFNLCISKNFADRMYTVNK